MRTFENRLANCAGLGLVAGAAIFGLTVHSNGYDPARTQQERVNDCAAQLGPKAKRMLGTALPGACEQFMSELDAQVLPTKVTYDLPGRLDFIEKYSPGAHYDRNHYLGWTAAALFWAGTVGAGSYILAGEFGSGSGQSKEPKPEPKPSEAVAAYVPAERRKKTEEDGPLPPDDLDGLQLHDLAMATSAEYRTTQAFKVTRRQLAALPLTPEL